MKGHMQDGKFHPHTQSTGVRKSRNTKTKGIKIENGIRKKYVPSTEKYLTVDNLKQFSPETIFYSSKGTGDPTKVMRPLGRIYTVLEINNKLDEFKTDNEKNEWLKDKFTDIYSGFEKRKGIKEYIKIQSIPEDYGFWKGEYVWMIDVPAKIAFDHYITTMDSEHPIETNRLASLKDLAGAKASVWSGNSKVGESMAVAFNILGHAKQFKHSIDDELERLEKMEMVS